MRISFSTLGCPDFSWVDIYTMAKDFKFDGIEIRGLGETFMPFPRRHSRRAKLIRPLRSSPAFI